MYVSFYNNNNLFTELFIEDLKNKLINYKIKYIKLYNLSLEFFEQFKHSNIYEIKISRNSKYKFINKIKELLKDFSICDTQKNEYIDYLNIINSDK